MTPATFRKIRLEARMSAKACAEYLRVTERSVWHYEAGERKIGGSIERLMGMLEEGTQAKLDEAKRIYDANVAQSPRRGELWDPFAIGDE